jgi:hypothetical protein
MDHKPKASVKITSAIRRLMRDNVSAADLGDMVNDPNIPISSALAARLILTALSPSEIQNEQGRVMRHDPVPTRAIAEIMDRIEGKAVQRQELHVTRDRDPSEAMAQLAALIAKYPQLASPCGDDALARVGTTRLALEASRNADAQGPTESP